jgi:hypothetical protein
MANVAVLKRHRHGEEVKPKFTHGQIAPHHLAYQERDLPESAQVELPITVHDAP